MNIFLADDDADDLLLFEEALMEISEDARLTTARNGEQLMVILGTSTPPPPHFIFLDLNMPLKNGFECLEELKADKKYRSIPVVVFSTSCQKEAIDRVYNKGADYYICKPDNFQKLKKLIRAVFSVHPIDTSSRPTRENFLLSA